MMQKQLGAVTFGMAALAALAQGAPADMGMMAGNPVIAPHTHAKLESVTIL